MARAWSVGALFLGLALSGCVSQDSAVGDLSLDLSGPDEPALPVTYPGYHLSAAFNEELWALESAYPDLVDVHEIGRSVMGRPILLATITNEAKRADGPRPIAFIDGCHHGNEIQGCEAPMFTAHFLASNYAGNATIRWILDSFEVHVVPTVNPDGRDLMTRVNANGINLNRNYPTDHGNPMGLSYPVGPPITPITWRQPTPWLPQPAASAIPSNVPFQRPVRPSENGGWAPLDQPETRAVNNWLTRIQPDLAIYITFHTSTHSIVRPWAAFNAPRPIPAQHDAVMNAMIGWVNGHMTYKGGTLGWGDTSGNLSYAASGSSMDWGYDRYEVPSFTVETFIPNATGWPTDVNFWGASSLIFVMKALMNVDKLDKWEMPDREFPYPAEWQDVHYFEGGPKAAAARAFEPEL